MAQASDPDGTIDYTYHNLGRTTKTIQTIEGLVPNVELRYTYDEAGNCNWLMAYLGGVLNTSNVYLGFRAGWPRAVARPGLPQIRTCATNASGSSSHGLAAQMLSGGVTLTREGFPASAVFPASGSMTRHLLPSAGFPGPEFP